MALEQQLDERLKQALKAKDIRTADVLRMLKTSLSERRTALRHPKKKRFLQRPRES